MRLIDKLIFKDLIGPFLNGLAMFMLLVFAIGYLFQATDLLLQGIGFAIVFKLVVFSLPEVVTQTFPMAMLLGSLLAFGRLSADHEAVAMFAAGVSFPRMVRVVALAGAVISVIAFLWNDYVVPPAKSAYWDLRQEAVMHLQKSDRPLSYTIEDKDNNTGVEEFVSINGGYDAPSRTLRRVSIIKYSHDPNRRGQIEAEIYCDHAIAKDQQGLDWNYYQGYLILYVPAKETGKIESSSIIDFDELKSSPRTPSPGKNFEGVMNADIIDSNRKSFRDLRAEIAQDRAKGRFMDARGKEVDLYGKIALPIASLIFGVLGAALGPNTQRGGSKTVGFGMAIFIVFLYYVFYRAMFVVGKNGGLPPILASFLADIVGAAIGLALAYRASR